MLLTYPKCSDVISKFHYAKAQYVARYIQMDISKLENLLRELTYPPNSSHAQ